MFSAIVGDVADRHPPSPGVTPWASAPKTVSVPCGFHDAVVLEAQRNSGVGGCCFPAARWACEPQSRGRISLDRNMETNSQRERSQNCRLCWVPNTTHITLIPGNSHRLASRLLISSLDFAGILFSNRRKTLKRNCNSCVAIAVFNFSLKRKCSETYQIETEAVFFPFRKPIRSNSFFFYFFF